MVRRGQDNIARLYPTKQVIQDSPNSGVFVADDLQSNLVVECRQVATVLMALVGYRVNQYVKRPGLTLLEVQFCSGLVRIGIRQEPELVLRLAFGEPQVFGNQRL